MVEQISRRGFLAAGVVGAGLVGLGGVGAVTRQAEVPYVRPPGSASNVALVASCNRCQKCLQACPYGIVSPVPLNNSLISTGTPMLVFEHAYCNFCMKCVDACPTGALSYGGITERDLGVAVVIKDACVAWDWLGCTLCKDECPVEGAITLDGSDRPVVHPEYCDGCGACEAVCPSSSLRAYNASVLGKGIVVVSRASEAAYAKGAISTEEFKAKHLVAVPKGKELPPHSKGIHPDGPDKMRDASVKVKGGLHENA